MFRAIKDLWEDKGFEILVSVCITLIIILFMYNLITGKKGSWSKNYYYPQMKTNILGVQNSTQGKKRQPPRESKGEAECRRCLVKIFGKPFNKDRPDFLRNPVTGGNFNLELDCFDSELGLAVEYNGVQHYKFIPFFHKNNEAFLNQKYRDDMKRRMCIDNGIKLIEVPHTVSVENIEGFLRKEIKKLGY